MILELCEGGDFSKYIRKHKRLSEKKAKYFMQHLGIYFLPSRKGIKKDIRKLGRDRRAMSRIKKERNNK